MQIDRCRDIVVLIALISLQFTEFHVVQITFHDLLVESRVVRPRKYNVHVWAV